MAVVKINGSRDIMEEMTPLFQPTRGDDNMEWQEKYIDKLNQDVTDIRSEIRGIRDEMRSMRQEMITEMRAIRQDFKDEMAAMRQENQADMKEIRSSLETTKNQVHNLVIAAVVGIAAITVSVIAFVATH